MIKKGDQYLWTEAYRPQTIHDCILPDRLKSIFQEYVTQKKVPNLILSGGPGVGKTTVARAMCQEIGCDFIVINGSDETGIDVLRGKIKNYASSVSLSGGRKVVILDEADYLGPSLQAGLRGAIEDFAGNCSFIFTANFSAKLIEPLHSRCACIDFTLRNGEKTKMASEFFKRVLDILKSGGVEYTESIVAELIKKYFPDFRRIINELQRYSQLGKIDAGVLAQISDVGITELVTFLAAKDFGSMRRWVATNEIDTTSFFRNIYDGLADAMEPASVPQAVLIIADYGYKAAFVADQEINTCAMLTELMVTCKFN